MMKIKFIWLVTVTTNQSYVAFFVRGANRVAPVVFSIWVFGGHTKAVAATH